jgi:Xaa-Pro aminopeptidase
MTSQKNPYSQIFIDDGLLKSALPRLRARREKLAAEVGRPVILCGLSEGPGGKNPWAMVSSFIFQDPLLLFLTGINQSHMALALLPKPHYREILFLRPKNPTAEFWEGLRFGAGDEKAKAEVQKITGFSDCRNLAELPQFLKNLKQKNIGTFWLQSETKKKVVRDHNFAFKNKLARLGFSVTNIAETQWTLRQCLDATDRQNTLLASQKTAEAFRQTLARLKTFRSEADVAAFLDGQIAAQSYFRNSFPSIVAGGQNATVLHYTKNNDPLENGELLLLDFGVRYHSMHADISRTVPVSGKFDAMQALLYGIVLDAQREVEKRLKPGITVSELNLACWSFINQELEKRFLKKGGKMKLRYKTQPHNVSHLIGQQVHEGDPFREYRTKPLEAGFLISNEPGLYGRFEMKIDGKMFRQDIGIRIEDNLLLTKNGCENMSASCPKSIPEIEKLIR